MPTPSALCIVEICREICIHVKERSRNLRRPRLSPARLARCSRAFSQPALDLLWETLNDMEPLLKLIPGLDVESRVVDSRKVKLYIIARTLRDNDWIRYDEYSRRVRTLRFSHTGQVNCDIYSQLTRHRQTPLLPSLRELYLTHHVSNEDLTSTLFNSEVIPLLNPSLRKLGVSTWDLGKVEYEDEELEEILRSLSGRCPVLQSLYLSGAIPLISLEPLSNLRHLTSLDLIYVYRVPCAFDSTTATALSTLPSLTDLSIPDVFIKYLGDPISSEGFLVLESLYIKCGDPPGIARTLRCISSPVLRKIHVEDVKRIAGRDLVEHLWAFSQFSGSLIELNWEEDRSTDFEETGFICMGIELLEPLLVLKNLETFRISLHASADNPHLAFSCQASRRIAEAWPTMKALSLVSQLFPFSLRSLITLVYHHKTLETLCFQVAYNDSLDPSSDQWLITRDTCARHGPCETTRLSGLYIGDILGADCDDLLLAAYLHTVFPAVGIISCFVRHKIGELLSLVRKA
ncbi:hypothetical protein JAAARDRAFT_40752 [Jaapia argillacea MUCL 33604]|uniref:F-box domain-containing protein n=1 Tax=Jaapia argillacea MUCL 33604 TaxID=933084 RepID=A0A067PD12_9AGAM|nr:hypothetical protein JAAARDRAFT_40752 [Jaapia argillacea MUCL 33604]